MRPKPYWDASGAPLNEEARLYDFAEQYPKEEQRAPLFSETYIDSITSGCTPMEAGMNVQRAFMSKITSGELMVVKMVGKYHEGCNAFGHNTGTEPWNFCPGCGAKIVVA